MCAMSLSLLCTLSDLYCIEIKLWQISVDTQHKNVSQLGVRFFFMLIIDFHTFYISVWKLFLKIWLILNILKQFRSGQCNSQGLISCLRTWSTALAVLFLLPNMHAILCGRKLTQILREYVNSQDQSPRTWRRCSLIFNCGKLQSLLNRKCFTFELRHKLTFFRVV